MLPQLRRRKSQAVVLFVLSIAATVVYIISLKDATAKHTRDLRQLLRRVKCEEPAVIVKEGLCMASPYHNTTAEYDMFNVYRDNVANGEEAKPDVSRKSNSTKLKVFVVPFTHVDPGWLETFEAYTKDTDAILDNMHRFMIANANMTFIWAELAFFEKWWSKQNSTTKEDVRRLVQSGRLEIASGSWVMTDEANVYYPLSVDNIIEGHEFLRQELDFSGCDPTFRSYPKMDTFCLPREPTSKHSSTRRTTSGYHHEQNRRHNVKRATYKPFFDKLRSFPVTQKGAERPAWQSGRDLIHYLNRDALEALNNLDKLAFGGVRPKVVWSNDPFGYSSSVPYLFTQAGIRRTIINRVHHDIKGFLQIKKAIPFLWRQYFDTKGDSDMLTHILPYAHYDILNSCGPNEAVCCEFDFRRMIDWDCPGRKPVPITSANVAERADLLMTQLKAMSQLYESNVLLMVHGDDFRYGIEQEWHQQHDNFIPLFREINTKGLAEIRFGTFSDYFEALEKWYANNGKKPATLSGDFFPYKCALGDMWTGYYTTRPFAKRQERTTHNIVRAADLMVTQALPKMNASLVNDLNSRLRKARQILSLFQHHDAITGTSRRHVMKDYSNLLHKASGLARSTFEGAAGALAGTQIRVLEYALNQTESETLATIKLTNPGIATLNVYNSLPYTIEDVVSLRIDTPQVSVSNTDGGIKAQIEPHIHKGQVSKDTFLLSFRCILRALSTSSFELKRDANPNLTTLSSVYSNDNASWLSDLPSVFRVKEVEGRDFYLTNELLRTFHDKETGQLTHVLVKATAELPLSTNFYTYRNALGGAYLMKVDGSPTRHGAGSPPRFLARGPIQETLHLFHPDIYQRFTVKKVEGSLGQQVNMLLRVDITGAENTELLLRVQTKLKQPIFYADSAGLQLLQRKRHDKLVNPANFYPMPSAAVLQDDQIRITVTSNVPHGVSPFDRGMDIVLDRILNQDDGKGLGSGPDSLPVDLLPVEMRFSLLIEKISKPEKHEYFTYHTPAGHLSVHTILYPPIITTGAVRAVENGRRLLTIYNSGSVCHTSTETMCTGELQKSLTSYLQTLRVVKVQETDLAGSPVSKEMPLDRYTPFVQPYKFLSLLLSFSN